MQVGALRSKAGALPLCTGTVVFGRGEHCDVVLESRSVSMEHARLTVSRIPRSHVRGSNTLAASIEDVGSRNGTFVNDSRIQGSSHDLVDGDVIRFGYDLGSFIVSLPGIPAPRQALRSFVTSPAQASASSAAQRPGVVRFQAHRRSDDDEDTDLDEEDDAAVVESNGVATPPPPAPADNASGTDEPVDPSAVRAWSARYPPPADTANSKGVRMRSPRRHPTSAASPSSRKPQPTRSPLASTLATELTSLEHRLERLEARDNVSQSVARPPPSLRPLHSCCGDVTSVCSPCQQQQHVSHHHHHHHAPNPTLSVEAPSLASAVQQQHSHHASQGGESVSALGERHHQIPAPAVAASARHHHHQQQHSSYDDYADADSASGPGEQQIKMPQAVLQPGLKLSPVPVQAIHPSTPACRPSPLQLPDDPMATSVPLEASATQDDMVSPMHHHTPGAAAAAAQAVEATPKVYELVREMHQQLRSVARHIHEQREMMAMPPVAEPAALSTELDRHHNHNHNNHNGNTGSLALRTKQQLEHATIAVTWLQALIAEQGAVLARHTQGVTERTAAPRCEEQVPALQRHEKLRYEEQSPAMQRYEEQRDLMQQRLDHLQQRVSYPTPPTPSSTRHNAPAVAAAAAGTPISTLAHDGRRGETQHTPRSVASSPASPDPSSRHAEPAIVEVEDVDGKPMPMHQEILEEPAHQRQSVPLVPAPEEVSALEALTVPRHQQCSLSAPLRSPRLALPRDKVHADGVETTTVRADGAERTSTHHDDAVRTTARINDEERTTIRVDDVEAMTMRVNGEERTPRASPIPPVQRASASASATSRRYSASRDETQYGLPATISVGVQVQHDGHHSIQDQTTQTPQLLPPLLPQPLFSASQATAAAAAAAARTATETSDEYLALRRYAHELQLQLERVRADAERRSETLALMQQQEPVRVIRRLTSTVAALQANIQAREQDLQQVLADVADLLARSADEVADTAAAREAIAVADVAPVQVRQYLLARARAETRAGRERDEWRGRARTALQRCRDVEIRLQCEKDAASAMRDQMQHEYSMMAEQIAQRDRRIAQLQASLASTATSAAGTAVVAQGLRREAAQQLVRLVAEQEAAMAHERQEHVRLTRDLRDALARSKQVGSGAMDTRFKVLQQENERLATWGSAGRVAELEETIADLSSQLAASRERQDVLAEQVATARAEVAPEAGVVRMLAKQVQQTPATPMQQRQQQAAAHGVLMMAGTRAG